MLRRGQGRTAQDRPNLNPMDAGSDCTPASQPRPLAFASPESCTVALSNKVEIPGSQRQTWACWATAGLKRDPGRFLFSYTKHEVATSAQSRDHSRRGRGEQGSPHGNTILD